MSAEAIVTVLVVLVLALIVWPIFFPEQCENCASTKVWPDRYDVTRRYCSDCGHTWSL